MKKLQYILVSTIVLFPIAVFAATNTLRDLIGLLAGYLNDALALFMGLAVLIFVYYIVMYFIKPNEGATDRAKAGAYVMYSILGFFIIFSMWGLVNILSNTFNLGHNTPGSWASMKNLFPQ